MGFIQEEQFLEIQRGGGHAQKNFFGLVWNKINDCMFIYHIYDEMLATAKYIPFLVIPHCHFWLLNDYPADYWRRFCYSSSGQQCYAGENTEAKQCGMVCPQPQSWWRFSWIQFFQLDGGQNPKRDPKIPAFWYMQSVQPLPLRVQSCDEVSNRCILS